MARIPDEEIERLKREISIERLVTPYGPKTEMSALWANSAFNRAYYGPWGQP